MQRRSDASCWGTMFQRKPRQRSLRVLRTGMPAVLSPHRSYWAHRTSKGGNTTMLTRRVFLRGSAIVMAGMGVAPGWLARAAAAESKKRKTLVAIFTRRRGWTQHRRALRRKAVPRVTPDTRD